MKKFPQTIMEKFPEVVTFGGICTSFPVVFPGIIAEKNIGFVIEEKQRGIPERIGQQATESKRDL